VRAGRGHGEARAIGGCAELAAHPQHFALELQHVRANRCAQFDDGLMHFPLDLIAQRQGARGEQLADVRAQCPGRGVDDLEFLFDADGEPMRHAVPPAGLPPGSPCMKHAGVTDEKLADCPRPQSCPTASRLRRSNERRPAVMIL
jgi:hypothetical protein